MGLQVGGVSADLWWSIGLVPGSRLHLGLQHASRLGVKMCPFYVIVEMQEGGLSFNRSLHISDCIIVICIPLAKASHMTAPQLKGQENTVHPSQGNGKSVAA